MNITLESLDLTPQELETARDRIRELAYVKWKDAGCPAEDSLKLWSLAEREWIAREYVPHREDLQPQR